MKSLHNRVSAAELKERLRQEDFSRITISFYKYFDIPFPVDFRNELYLLLHEMEVFGRIYVAEEGINAQISVPEHYMEAFRQKLFGFHPALDQLRLNIAIEDDGKSFWVLKIKVRPKIVADGIEDPSFDPADTGKYLKVEEFNELAEKEDTVIIDMRNHYEYEVGHFKNAVEIPSDTFKEQLPMAIEMMQNHRDKEIIMYCTGGIRCEKASAYFKHHGFSKVHHVEGGIIEYSRRAAEKNLENKFIGKNFVFDDRLGESISGDVIAQCHQCGNPCDTHTNCANDGCHLLFIQCTECRSKYQNCCSPECQEINNLPAEAQKKLRKGVEKGQMIFNKSRDHKLRPRRADIQDKL